MKFLTALLLVLSLCACCKQQSSVDSDGNAIVTFEAGDRVCMIDVTENNLNTPPSTQPITTYIVQTYFSDHSYIHNSNGMGEDIRVKNQLLKKC